MRWRPALGGADVDDLSAEPQNYQQLFLLVFYFSLIEQPWGFKKPPFPPCYQVTVFPSANLDAFHSLVLTQTRDC